MSRTRERIAIYLLLGIIIASAGIPVLGRPVMAAGYPLTSSDVRIQAALDYFNNSTQAQTILWNDMEKACYTIVAVEACGGDAHTVTNSSGKSLIDVIKENAPAKLKPQNSAALVHEYYLFAIVAAGENPRDFTGIDPLQQLKDMFDGTQVGMSGIINDDFWAVISLVGAGENPSSEIIQVTKDHIIANQSPDGGWGSVTGGTGSDPCDTANAIMALRAAGVNSSSPAIKAGLAYLKTMQRSDGGFPYMEGYSSDSASDARVIGALRACSIDPTGSEWSIDGNNAVTHALSLQQPDGGFSWYAGGSSDPWMTTYILPALAGKHWPPDLFTNSGNNSSTSSGSSSGTSTTTLAAAPAGDYTAPSIDAYSPTFSENAVPVITADFKDDRSGIDAASVILKIDGTDVSSQATITAGSMTYTPGEPLRNGTHMVELIVYDRSGNRTRATWNIRVDAPDVTQTTPGYPQGTAQETGTPELTDTTAEDGQVAGIDGEPTGTTISLAALLDESGALTADMELESPEAIHRLTIFKGTTVSFPGSPSGSVISMSSAEKTPVLTGGYCRIGAACEIGPEDARLSSPSSLTFSYDEIKSRESVRWDTNGDGVIDLLDDDIVITPEDMMIARYDSASGEWNTVESIIDTGAKTVTARIEKLSLFALVAPVTRPVVVLDIKASPETLDLGQKMTFIVTVENPGTARGTYVIPLKIDGVLETSQEVVLNPGQHTLEFVHDEPYLGTHQADAMGRTVTFTVNSAATNGNWWESVDIVFYLYIIVGVVCIGVITGGILFSRMRRRKKAQ